MHQLDRRRARVERAGPRADHALAVQRLLQPRIVDEPRDHVGDGRLEQRVDQLGVVAECFAQLVLGWRVADPRVTGLLPQRPAHPVEEVLVLELALDVGVGEAVLAHAGCGAVGVEELPVPGPVVEGAPDSWLGDEHLVPVTAQRQLVDHPLIEEPDDVGARTDPVLGLGERLLQRARAAEPLAALQDEHRLAGLRQVGGARQAVVATADDDHVPRPGGELGDRGRQPDLTQAIPGCQELMRAGRWRSVRGCSPLGRRRQRCAGR